MEGPSKINSVYWDDQTKSWQYKMIKVDEYHGFVECQHCRKPMSHNIKSDGEYKIVYVKCGCARDNYWISSIPNCQHILILRIKNYLCTKIHT